MSPNRGLVRGTLLLCWPAVALLLASASAARAQDEPGEVSDDGKIGLADLPAYLAALSGRPTADDARSSDPPRRASFRDLWDRPDTWRGRRVRVEGKVARVFRQGAIGSLPPLAEAWLATPAGDLFCVVFPDGGTETGAKRRPAEPGAAVRFTGTFLRRVRYPAGDEPRLAPLIVGEHAPEEGRTSPASLPRVAGAAPASTLEVRAEGDAPLWSPTAWILALVLGSSALAVLLWQHLGGAAPGFRPRRRRSPRADDPGRPDPPLEFLGPEVDRVEGGGRP